MCSIHSAAGEPPWPGWLGKYTLKSFARRSWNASQRPAPPAPCRNRSGGPEPSWSIWTGVPRTESSCAASASQPMKRPPFGESHCPVKNELSSETRKSAVAATSCGSPVRRSGVRAITAVRISGDIRSVIGVSM